MKNKIIILFILCFNFMFSQTIELKQKHYSIIFDTVINQPLSVSYTLKKEMLNGNFNRTIFKSDPKVSKKKQGTDKDYLKTIFDKGHLAPNDDFKFSLQAQKESMYFTNCVPQNRFLNRGTWKSLENYCRDLALKSDVLIQAGVIYSGSKQYIGKLLVPVFFYKIIFYDGIYEAYLIPNIKPKFDNFSLYQINYLKLKKKINGPDNLTKN